MMRGEEGHRGWSMVMEVDGDDDLDWSFGRGLLGVSEYLQACCWERQ